MRGWSCCIILDISYHYRWLQFLSNRKFQQWIKISCYIENQSLLFSVNFIKCLMNYPLRKTKFWKSDPKCLVAESPFHDCLNEPCCKNFLSDTFYWVDDTLFVILVASLLATSSFYFSFSLILKRSTFYHKYFTVVIPNLTRKTKFILTVLPCIRVKFNLSVLFLNQGSP